MKKILYALCAASAVALATPALADNPPPVYLGGTAPCSYNYAVGGIACQGYYDHNQLQKAVGDPTPDDIKFILNQLLTNPGYTPNPTGTTPTSIGPGYVAGSYTGLNFNTILGAVENQTDGNAVFDFGSLNLSGLTIFGAHFGNNNDPGAPNNTDITAFWLLNLGAGVTHTVTLTNGQGVSNARIYATSGFTPPPPPQPVPEPATWAMMLLGFMGVGMAMRRRKTGVIQQLA